MRLILAFAALALGACTAVGPDYRKPDLAQLVPGDWRWRVAAPKDEAPKGEWWKVFNDPVLDELQRAALASSQTLRAAVARVDEARAVARLTRSQFFPELSLDPLVKAERTSGNLPTPIPVNVPSARFTTYSLPLDLRYELDLWGRVRRSFEAAQAQAQASVSDYQNVLLTLTADIAANYFLMRALDAEIAVLRRTMDTREKSLAIVRARAAAGSVPGVDLAQAQTELATAKTDLAEVVRSRVETLHALALLSGQPASAFEIAEGRLGNAFAVVPAHLPSTLLERRPDIARAERTLAARNAQIGVARAAYFPSIQLVGQGGVLSDDARRLISSESLVWSLGPRISLPLFTAGRTAADVRRAEAAYEAALAEYRQSVIGALREVEDSLAQIVLRNEQRQAQAAALASAGRVLELVRARYDAGAVNYLELAEAERNLLRHERRDAQLHGQRAVASVRLIKALGGGWDEPTPLPGKPAAR